MAPRQLFLRVEAAQRARVAARTDVDGLRSMIMAGEPVPDIAAWLTARRIPIALTRKPDLATAEWLTQLGDPDHRIKLGRSPSRMSLRSVMEQLGSCGPLRLPESSAKTRKRRDVPDG